MLRSQLSQPFMLRRNNYSYLLMNDSNLKLSLRGLLSGFQSAHCWKMKRRSLNYSEINQPTKRCTKEPPRFKLRVSKIAVMIYEPEQLINASSGLGKYWKLNQYLYYKLFSVPLIWSLLIDLWKDLSFNPSAVFYKQSWTFYSLRWPAWLDHSWEFTRLY